MNLGYIEADREFRFTSDIDGFELNGYVWEWPEPKALVVIAHGAAEHSLRYGRFARALNQEGYEVWSLDHRGHGKSPGPEGLGDFGEGGWDALVADIVQFVGLAKAEHPQLPVALFGHSMGSAAAQQLAPEASDKIDALVLSGSSATMGRRDGETRQWSPNAAFEPARTNYDWLSRDEAEVDKYIADPLCGFETQTSARRGWASAEKLTDPARLKGIRSDLPCLFVAGDKDPVNRDMAGLIELERLWHEAGVEHIATLYYQGGRHEMLNETNRDQVTAHIIDWLDCQIGEGP